MEDLKIRVTTAQESKEAQELAVKAGYELDTMFGQRWNSEYSYLALCGDMSAGFATNGMVKNDKEITIPQLRDLVVLKRNDPKDATHSADGESGLAVMLSGVWYGYNFNEKKWELWVDDDEYQLKDLKQIEKEMKEYLDKDYVLRQVKQTGGNNRVPSGWIEVPEGAEIFTEHERWDCFYKKGEDSLEFFDNNQWEVGGYDTVNYENEMNRLGRIVVWQRESPNDKAASAEVARQGMKFDSDKPRHSLLPKGAVNSVISVLEFGAKKYEAENWKKVDNAKERYYNAAMRHIDLWWNGEKFDPETKIHHLAHAATNLFFLMWFDNK